MAVKFPSVKKAISKALTQVSRKNILAQLSISEEAFARIEAGEMTPTAKVTRELAAAIGLEPLELANLFLDDLSARDLKKPQTSKRPATTSTPSRAINDWSGH